MVWVNVVLLLSGIAMVLAMISTFLKNLEICTIEVNGRYDAQLFDYY